MGRRRFVQGLTTGGMLASLGLLSPGLLRAAPNPDVAVLDGPSFDLTIDEVAVNFTGQPRMATAINGSVPAPVLRMREGDDITIRVTNRMSVTSSLHWHGLILPSNMDGVPGLSFAGIKPGGTYTYHFKAAQSGTYWYHSHSGFQEQTGMYGAIVIEPRNADPVRYDREYVVLFSDWSDERPEQIFAKLKKLSHYYNTRERTLGDFSAEVSRKGLGQAMQDRKMWNEMRMSDRDLSDVTGWTYTFLANGKTPNEGWEGMFRPGERVRLRLINGSAMTFFDVRIPGLKMEVVAADGQNIRPVRGIDEIRMGVAETYDVIVQPQAGAYTVFAQAIDRSGYARGTLTSQPGQKAAIPAFDPMPILTHADMGMGGTDMAGMDHSAMGHDMSQMGQPRVPVKTGPQVDMMAMAAQVRLDDPGVGLRNNGRRVLTYADIRNLTPTIDQRPPGREIELHLTGNMNRYMWSINSVKFADAKPIVLKFGERVRFTLINDTMMNHPIHQHGMWSELETGDPNYLPRKHTVIVQPGAKISYLLSADARGQWAYHCHLLYHMEGMMRRVVVA
ncbi:MAG: copper resistance system multicopper oxidase [Gammaproteobacteria bacterium]|nr:copper resistance system multicopper oxidase [Gammaproteobacteria bacterium]MBU1724269.1 copper resistance system multicopper oxidase [Gammaproteobacteria bacterium]MBU2006303.1 copper resistance system multicopper oxidase [Gammaproteobacteria bacterium]